MCDVLNGIYLTWHFRMRLTEVLGLPRRHQGVEARSSRTRTATYLRVADSSGRTRCSCARWDLRSRQHFPMPAVIHAAPTPVIEHNAPVPAVTCIAPAPVVEYMAPEGLHSRARVTVHSCSRT